MVSFAIEMDKTGTGDPGHTGPARGGLELPRPHAWTRGGRVYWDTGPGSHAWTRGGGGDLPRPRPTRVDPRKEVYVYWDTGPGPTHVDPGKEARVYWDTGPGSHAWTRGIYWARGHFQTGT